MRKSTAKVCCYLQGLQALQEGLGFVLVLFRQAGIRIGARPAVWLRLGRQRGAVLFGTVVLLLHFRRQFILTHTDNKTRG